MEQRHELTVEEAEAEVSRATEALRAEIDRWEQATRARRRNRVLRHLRDARRELERLK